MMDYQTSPGDVVFRSKSPGPGEYQNLLLHSGVLIPAPTNNISTSSQHSQRTNYPRSGGGFGGVGGVPLKCPGVEERIVCNLRYSLEQLKLSSDGDQYRQLVDCVVVGPAHVKQQDLTSVLGINQEFVARSKQNRNNIIQSGARPGWTERSERSQSVPAQARRVGRTRRDLTGPGLTSGLERQFHQFCRFGSSQGRLITLTENDKWMRGAKLLDNWTVTTMDTALAFRFKYCHQAKAVFSFLVLGRFQEGPSGWITKNGGNFWMN